MMVHGMLKSFSITIMLAFISVGCGGSSGGGSGDSQLNITTENASQVAAYGVEAIESVGMATDLMAIVDSGTLFSSIESAGEPLTLSASLADEFKTLTVSEPLLYAFLKVGLRPSVNDSERKLAVVQEIFSESRMGLRSYCNEMAATESDLSGFFCPCGGSAKVSETDTSIKIVFNRCVACDEWGDEWDEFVMDGTIKMNVINWSGYDQAFDCSINLTENYKDSYGDTSKAVTTSDFKVGVMMEPSRIKIADMYMKISSSGTEDDKPFNVSITNKNYNFIFEEGVANLTCDYEINGTYGDKKFQSGFVNIKGVNLRISDNDYSDFPESGTMTVTGAGGTSLVMDFSGSLIYVSVNGEPVAGSPFTHSEFYSWADVDWWDDDDDWD